jgi:eukaryotic-like serine/threonine-protein kinase
MTTLEEEPDAVTEFLDPLVTRARGRLGQMLRNKWRLDVLLGVGGMAAVYAATHRNGNRAAVKVLHTELSANEEVRARFMREGYVANSVGHEGAVKVLDDDVADDGSMYLVTELLDGETLEDRRVRFGGRLSEDDVLSVTDQVLDVLVAAHSKGVIHRDVKPANIFLTRSGQLKVLDFGIARLRELSTISLATRSGLTMGTPAFMSQEQARGLWNEVDARSDIWSVGATMWHALTGKLVHDGRTANEELLSAMTKPAPPLSSVLVSVSPAVARVVDRALAFDKEKRWLDAQRMQEAVRRAYHDRHSAPITTAPRLTVPETVPDRTLSSASDVLAPHLTTTGRPVANSRGGQMGSAPSRRLVVTAAVGIVGIVVSGIAWVVSAGHGSASNGGSSSTPSQATAVRVPPQLDRPAAVTELTPIETLLPAIAATDLPTAVETPTARATPVLPPSPPKGVPAVPSTAMAIPSSTRPEATSPPLPASAAPSPSNPDCSPAYTVDPTTHMKKWKVECL